MNTLAAGLLFFLCSASQASDFRFCEMEGTVQAASPYSGKKARVFDLKVAVDTAQMDESSEFGGYTDCREFVGESVQIRLQIPRRFAPPAVEGPDHMGVARYGAIEMTFTCDPAPSLL